MKPTHRLSGIPTEGTSRLLVGLLRGTVVLLALQYLLGMWVNLFGPVPPTNDLGAALSYTGDPAFTAHVALAVLLLTLGIVIVFVSFREETRVGLRIMVLLGLLSIFWASVAGVQFVRSGFSSNTASFSMALAFIVATSCYGIAQVLVLPQVAPAPAAIPPEGALPPSEEARD